MRAHASRERRRDARSPRTCVSCNGMWKLQKISECLPLKGDKLPETGLPLSLLLHHLLYPPHCSSNGEVLCARLPHAAHEWQRRMAANLICGWGSRRSASAPPAPRRITGEGPRAGPGSMMSPINHRGRQPQIHLGAGTQARSRIQFVLIRYESSGHVLQQPFLL